MTELAIRTDRICKYFKVYANPSEMVREVITGRKRHREFHALSDVSINVSRGEVVGLVGRNGAGKSTLLRILAGTLEASSGAVEVAGRVSAILELGTGFNPDYTGRENIYLGGMCLGLSREEVHGLESDIVAFSELQEFIDQPFKTYSSGMQARLTFSVAVSVNPDILIVDEALSVGDAKFQLKSFDRMRSFRRDGKTIFVVSHDINSLAMLCDRAILLDHGRVLADGEPNHVGKVYHELLFSPKKEGSPDPAVGLPDVLKSEMSQGREHRYGDNALMISTVAIVSEGDRVASELRMGDSYRIRLMVDAQEDVDDYVIGLLIRTPKGVEVMGTDTRFWETSSLPDALQKGHRYRFDIEFKNNLARGKYFLTAALAKSDGYKYDMRFDCLMFEVVGLNAFYDNSLCFMPITFTGKAIG